MSLHITFAAGSCGFYARAKELLKIMFIEFPVWRLRVQSSQWFARLLCLIVSREVTSTILRGLEK